MLLATLQKFNEDEPRDDRGRWTDGGGSDAPTSFISPNTGNLSFAEAVTALTSDRQKNITAASAHIDEALGIKSTHYPAIGAWADGAENSMIVVSPGASTAQVRAASAMKGYVSDQKSVLVFNPDATGNDFLASFNAVAGKPDDLHNELLKAGLSHHTLQPLGADRYRVHVYGSDEATADAIDKASQEFDAVPEFAWGSGEFIGTTKEDGTDREQRNDARQQYEKVIREIAASGALEGQNVGDVWDEVRNRWDAGSSQGTADSTSGHDSDGPARARSADEAQRVAATAARGYAPLAGLPQKPIKVGDEWYVPGPIGAVKAAAESYMKTAGLPYTPPTTYLKVDKDRAGRIATEFEAMKHDPNDPATKASYAALAKEVGAQWQAVKATGLKIEFIKEGQPDPYVTSLRMAAMDVIHNNHLWVFPTTLGFGSDTEGAAEAKNDNPMLQDTGEVVDGHKMLVNDQFRIVHDYFGHFKEGVGFRADGEENAWRSHAAMFTPLARAALTSETRGQNSWLNFGPPAEHNKTASPADTIYAPQKIGIMANWTSDEGRLDPGKVEKAPKAFSRMTMARASRNLPPAMFRRYYMTASEFFDANTHISRDLINDLVVVVRSAPLYVHRDLQNVDAFKAWATAQGFDEIDDDLHVTVLYSKSPVDWDDMGDRDTDTLTVPAGGERTLELLGEDEDAVALVFASTALARRHGEMLGDGASSDYDAYVPHVTINLSGVIPDGAVPYDGELVFGPEIFETITKEKEFDPNEPRDDSGKWTDGGGSDSAGGDAAGNYGLVPGDVEKFKALKAEWGKINNELLDHVDDPAGTESTAKLFQLESLVKEMQTLRADPGGPAGIGLPGGPRDVLIVGAGPGGLAASINGAAEGLDTLVVEANVVAGGQAKFSSRIENFPGFPVGVTGKRLTQSMFTQAQRLGAEAKLGVRVTGLTVDDKTGVKHVTLSNGEKIDSRTVIIAGGLEFRKIPFEGVDGPGVIVGDGEELSKEGKGGPVVVVGGSNGAAQAALGAAQTADHVYLLSRSPIVNSMSSYVVTGVRNNPKITVIENDEISKLWRDEHGDPQTVETKGGQKIPTKAVGIFAGSVPETRWIPAAVERGKDGKRLHTNADFETAIPGVYAIGDMRDAGAGRVGVAVGEGQLALRHANSFLEDQKSRADQTGAAAKANSDTAKGMSSGLITRLFDLDRDNPWFGQTAEDVNPPKKKTSRKEGFNEDEPLRTKFDPSEPRDEGGKWTDGGGDGGTVANPSSAIASGDGPPVVAFHGTIESVVDSIKKEGLHVKPGSHHFDGDVYAGDRGESVFVTTKESVAIEYASTYAQAESWKEYKAVTPVLFRLEVPQKEWANFHEDKLTPDTGSHYTKAIPPEWIKGVFKIKPDESLEAIKSALAVRSEPDHVRAFMVIYVGEPKDKVE